MKRKYISTTLVIIFIVITITGILLFLLPHSKSISSIHTLFTFTFLGVALFHIVKNFKQLINYSYNKKKKIPFNIYIIVVIFLSLVAILAINKDLPYANTVYNYGNALRSNARNVETNKYNYDIIDIKNSFDRLNIDIDIKKGPIFRYPLFAIWMEDLDSNYINSVFVAQSISNSVFKRVLQKDNSRKPGIVRRPEALPYWSHKRNIIASDGLLIPLGEAKDLDGVTGTTPINNTLIKLNTSQPQDSLIRLLLEVNQSYDWNEYYYKGRFKNDTIYNGDGSVGQPSLIYEALINTNGTTDRNLYFMELIGHGHQSGKNGKLYKDLSNITTAKEIIDRIVIKVY